MSDQATVTDDEIYGRAALKLGEPWIVPQALAFLKTVVQPGWKVFEWGSGGSTVFWSRHCLASVTIEHNSEWMQRTTKLLFDAGCRDNWVLYYKALDGTDHRTAGRGYADVVNRFRDGYFDLISVDGEASSRGWCIENAVPKVKPGGYLLLDNSDWFKGDLGWDKTDYVARDLKWIGQEGTFDWWTSILRKPA